jgi:hypothetical protein
MRAMNRWLVFWIGIQFVGSVAAAQFDFSIPSKELSKLSIADPAAYRDLAEECSVVFIFRYWRAKCQMFSSQK